jgi:hypothetical protein
MNSTRIRIASALPLDHDATREVRQADDVIGAVGGDQGAVR